VAKPKIQLKKVEVKKEIKTEIKLENKRICLFCEEEFDLKGKTSTKIKLCQKCSKTTKDKCQGKSGTGNPCKNYACVAFGKYCASQHLRLYFKEKLDSEGKVVCSNYKRNRCHNEVDEKGFARCSECREVERAKDNKRYAQKKEVSLNSEVIEVDGIDVKLCGFFNNKRPVSSFKDIHGEESAKCDKCRERGQILSDRPRKERNKKDPCNSLKSKLKDYQKDAKRDNKIWNLTEKDAYSLYSMPCHYCGDLPKIKEGKCNGIDRINSDEKEYNINNIIPCCGMCNRMKRVLNYNDFLKIVEHVATFNGLYDGKLSPNLFYFSQRGKLYVYRNDANQKNKKRPNTENDYSFNLTQEELDKIIKMNCHYCGLKPNRSKFEGGLDKVNNKVGGYSVENNVSCCTVCNFLKSDFDKEEFLQKCLQIVKNCNKIETFQNRQLLLNEIKQNNNKDEGDKIKLKKKSNSSSSSTSEHKNTLNARHQQDFRSRQIESVGYEEFRKKQNSYYKQKKSKMSDKYKWEDLEKHTFKSDNVEKAKKGIILMIKNDEDYMTTKELSNKFGLSSRQITNILSYAK